MEGDLLHLRSGKDSFISKNVLLTLTSKTLSHNSSGVSNIKLIDGLIAALDTKISNPPKSALVCNFSQLYNLLFISIDDDTIYNCEKWNEKSKFLSRKVMICYTPYFLKQIFPVLCFSYMADCTSDLQALGFECLYSLFYVCFLTATDHYLRAFLC